jgi:hypothetical protein
MSTPFKIDFVGIGASKSGTTWLGHMLEVHPQLCMSVPKEVHFFNDTLTYRNRIMEFNYHKGVSWYKKHFNHCKAGSLKGDITPRYSHDPKSPQRIYDHNKDIKIFYCLRSPVDRIESHYNFAKYFVGKEDRPMEQAIREEPEFIIMSMYFRNLNQYLQLFPKEQIMLIWFEDIRDRPEGLLEEVYRFLNVDPSFRPARMNEKSNPGRASKNSRLQDRIRQLNHWLISLGFSGFVNRIKKAGIGDFVQRLNSKPLRKEKITPEIKAWIIDQVRDDVLQLQAWSGRDLSHWLK